MCGLVAMISRQPSGFFQRDAQMFKSMLMLDGWWRGLDGTGAYQILKNRQVAFVKHAGDPLSLFRSQAWGDFERRMVSSARIQVGHNRKATQGGINSQNAHPFHEGNIILVHNGTLFGHKDLADTEVDSQAIAKAFNEEGHEKALKRIRGAFALIWYDIEKEKLFAIRNKDRPLYMTVTERTLFLNSEPWMAKVAISRDDGQDPSKFIKEVIEFQPGLLYEFDLDGTYTTKQVELAPAYTKVLHDWWDACGWKPSQYSQSRSQSFRHESTTTTTRPALPAPTTKSKENLGNDLPKIFPEASQHFSIGGEVILKINQIRKPVTSNGRSIFSFTGQTMSPGKPAIDVHGTLPIDTDEAEVNTWYRDWVVGRVLAINYTNCGAYLQVTEIRKDDPVKLHNTTMGQRELDHVLLNCVCKECNATIFDEDLPFTSVKRLGTNTQAAYKVTCADCVEKALPEGKLKDEFIERRYASLQAGLEVGQKSGGGSEQPTQQTGSVTLH